MSRCNVPFLRRGCAGLAAAVLVLAGAARVSAAEGERVIDVEARGAQTVARETILAKVQTKAGMSYQSAIVSEDIRRLFALGYFTDVKAEVERTPEGLRLVFMVVEKPTISVIQVEGQRFLRHERLLQLFGVKAGELYDPRRIKEGVDRLKAEYARKGFSDVEIVSRAETDEQANTATVYLVVDEGARMRIHRVLVEGNQAFPDRRILKLLKTKRRFWFTSGAYTEQVLEEDLERVRAFYRTHGYQDVEAEHSIYRDPSGRGLLVHLKIVEGLQHRVGQVALEGVRLFPEREVLRVITLKPGAVFSTDALQEDLRLIKQFYGDRGYIRAEVTPDPQLDPSSKRVNLTYRIEEHDVVTIRRVEIQGNLRTKDIVVRRDLRAYPGERFDGAKIRKSIERLYNLGYFEEVSVDTRPTGAPDQEDLLVKVKESKTGSFSFGGGFSSVDRLVGLVELEQRNFDLLGYPHFTGAGQDIRFRVEVGTVRRYFDLSFTEPWIFGHPVSLGLDVYNRTRLRSRSLGLAFEEEQRGAGVRLGKEFFDRLVTTVGYQLFRTSITNVVDEASADLKAEQGRNTISELNISGAYDARNNRLDPTSGYYLFTSADLAGGPFGADRDFYRAQTGASLYVPHLRRFVFEGRVRAGIVKAFGDSERVPIFERFYGGGSGTIRGFEERRVGPRDPSSNDPIGGEATMVGTMEEVMTIVKNEQGKPIIKGAVFFDVGDVWRKVQDFGETFKAGTGVGARVNTPIGPVRLDLGFPLSDVAGEKQRPRFHFNISRSF
ncbi:MAG: outer membrane protein assembly factor BamA [Candidatus Omnitrophica bacterium]|nr:outer membrane protein assembly factor BamA [Candidatus Omnitrophota bacterium]